MPEGATNRFDSKHSVKYLVGAYGLHIYFLFFENTVSKKFYPPSLECFINLIAIYFNTFVSEKRWCNVQILNFVPQVVRDVTIFIHGQFIETLLSTENHLIACIFHEAFLPQAQSLLDWHLVPCGQALHGAPNSYIFCFIHTPLKCTNLREH